MFSPARLSRALQADLAERRRPASAGRLSLLEWCARHIRIRGRAFSLEQHEYLREPYTVEHPYMVFQKAAQVGISSRALYEGFHLAEEQGAKVLYYLSTDQDARDFSDDRINIAIDDSEHLGRLVAERERGRDNVGLRHLGQGSIFCRGMFTRRKVKAVDGDVLVLDELDEADQTNKRFALDRILHSALQYVRELSQPSIPDYGIHETFQRSDQRHWHLRCPGCGRWNCLELHLEEREGRPIPRHFFPVPTNALWARAGQRYYRGCLHCRHLLDMNRGEWVALEPSRVECCGFQVSQLYRALPVVGFPDPADWIMDKLLSARRTMDKLRATISILGMPYAGDRAPLTDQVLDACEGEEGYLERAESSFMGIDQGDELFIVVGRAVCGEKLQVIWAEQTEDWGRLLPLMRQYHVCGTVGDAMPNKQSMKEVARAAGAPFYIQYFAGATLQQGEEGEAGRAVRKLTVDRTESLDETVAALKEGRIILPDMGRLGGEALRTHEVFRAQLKTLVKDLVEDARGVRRWQYKRGVPNHFGMALNSMRLAAELHRGVRVEYEQMQTSGLRTLAARLWEREPEEERRPRPEAPPEEDLLPESPLAGALRAFAY